MTIDEEFLTKLRCPRTHKPLRPMSAAEREALSAAVARGDVATVGGRKVEAAVEEGLVPDGERFVYPVDGGIPILLSEEAIPFPD